MRCTPFPGHWLVAAVLALAGMAVQAQPASSSKPASPKQAKTAASSEAKGPQFVDGIAAVVNKQVITLRQVDAEVAIVRKQMQAQNIPVPEAAIMRRQVLERLITQELERQEAKRLGIKVTDAQVQDAVKSVADRNKISVDNLRKEIERSGLTWDSYKDSLRDQMRRDLLRQRTVDPTIVISDNDVDAFLKSQGQSVSPAAAPNQPQVQPQPVAAPRVLGLAQILVKVPESASPSQIRELRAKAEQLLAKVRGGADFAGVAASSSDGPEALNGGNLGVRAPDGWPDLFLKATRNLKAGQISDIVQSGNGFHILKVTTTGEKAASGKAASPARAPAQEPARAPQAQQGPMMVTQTHARHILIKTNQVMTDDQAKARLEQIRQRIVNGEKFEDMAKRYSDDSSAPLGGDLGWLTPGETVAPFQRAMDALEPGQVSEPVQSQFGWHLIQVLERRTQNMENEFKRMRARQTLFERRAEPAFEDWLNRLRGEAYIDNRLDPRRNQNVRR
jgi:peptidyl-prolyl cis-trans isomerase SurA